MNSHNRHLALLLCVLLINTEFLYADNNHHDSDADTSQSLFLDSLDQNIDLSKWLMSRYGILPTGSIITEPAVGFGFALGLVYMYDTPGSVYTGDSDSQTLILPSMTFAFGLYTQNTTRGVGGGHYGTWNDDRIRYTGFIAWLDLVLTFYRTDIQGREVHADFNLTGIPFYQSIMHRLGDSKWLFGIDYTYYQNDVLILRDTNEEILTELEKVYKLGGLGLKTLHDNVDNSFTPNRGTKFYFKYSHFDTWLGGDYVYDKLDSYFILYGDWIKKLVMGFNLNAQSVFGDVPFFAKPFINMRGIPIMRYQGDYIVTFQNEERWKVSRRWNVIGFLGLGYAWDEDEKWNVTDAKWAGGAGIRYLIARLFGIYAGLDVARGPEEWAIYITLGNAWTF
jgi:hypothetical protein